MALKSLALVLLAATAIAKSSEIDHVAVNKKIFDYTALHEAFSEAVRRGAKVIISCEEQTCPFSKVMTRFVKKELKNVNFDSYMLRIER